MRRRWSVPTMLAAVFALSAPVALGGSAPAGAASACTARAFVANNGAGNVSVLDTATASVVGSSIPVGAGPSDVAMTSDGSRVYVTNSNATPGSVSAIDVASRSVAATITVGASPEGIAVTACATPVAPLTPLAPAPDALVSAPRFTG